MRNLCPAIVNRICPFSSIRISAHCHLYSVTPGKTTLNLTHEKVLQECYYQCCTQDYEEISMEMVESYNKDILTGENDTGFEIFNEESEENKLHRNKVRSRRCV